MYCPNCKAEYRKGFDTCSDCDIKLVDELPPEPEPEFIHYKEVLGTYNPADIAIIKSILDAEGIRYYFNGEHFMYVRPLAEPARLMVDEEEAEIANDLLKDLDLTIGGIGTGLGKED